MKRVLLILAISIIGGCYTHASAQIDNGAEDAAEQTTPKHRCYIEIQGVQSPLNAQAYEIKIQAGKMFHEMTNTKPAAFNELKTKYELRLLPDALNLFSMYGWELTQTYVTSQNGTICTHCVMSKAYNKPEELTVGILKD